MAETKIEWAEKTWNPITGCSKISPGCQNCYAERMAKRLAGRCGYPKDNPFAVTLHPDRLDEPLKWKKPSRVFVCSMGDLFHEDVDYTALSMIWSQMVVAEQHTFMILTKRPQRMMEFVAGWINHMRAGSKKPIENIWLGVTAENQEMANRRVPILLQIPAVLHWVSYEPALGPIDIGQIIMPDGDHLTHYFNHGTGTGIDWVICGGESGPGARPMHPDWVRSLRDQCVASQVPFFFKQWGEWLPISQWEDAACFVIPESQKGTIWIDGSFEKKLCRSSGESKGPEPIYFIGKKATGRLLDGREWEEMPDGPI